eukprot:CAMPEP_0181243114 /NCGR_PEP_ID=MMETSP1096-20121128/42073_1 /TAXON_ID=156174 ORGANISM="Chrysochromulina ericina, Strain CCMP281" /NCGR_SAMPLE_ID=MMETSP1096 /ASSEMBLY_ACC=CAM_ASM_000453 /LENGTH=87 /DNA_ID=CAMNT_0023339413 /DNA_START=109 /DNA_END=371 /DNA_ORIENTATION=+
MAASCEMRAGRVLTSRRSRSESNPWDTESLAVSEDGASKQSVTKLDIITKVGERTEGELEELEEGWAACLGELVELGDFPGASNLCA